MDNNGGDLKKKLLESLPDEIDDELFRQLQNDINKTVREYEGASESNDDTEFDYDSIMEKMSDVQMPPELEERLKKINEKYLASCEAGAAAEEKERKRARRRKHMRSAAAVIAAFAIISGGILWKAPQAEAFRLKLYDTVFSPTDEDVGVEFIDTVYNNMPVIEDEELKAKANEIIDRDGFILYPSVLPDGYELSEIENEIRVKLKFKCQDDESMINISYYPEAQAVQYNDSDNSENIEMLVNGQTAILRDGKSKSEIYWSSDNLIIKLNILKQSMTGEKIVELAEGIKKYYKIL